MNFKKAKLFTNKEQQKVIPELSQVLIDNDEKVVPGFKTIGNVLVATSLLVGVPALASANTVEPPKTIETTSLVSSNDLNVEVDHSQATALNVENIKGVPVVSIENPNQVGVSDNRFKNFSTTTGVVFKNNTIQVDSSVLKQKLAANPNLKKAASVILAQVTGNNKSVIRGTLEILGNKADLLIINPNGIELNGVNLVNTRDFTAATAEVNANNYKQMRVTSGEINVTGDLTTDDVNVLKLIAQAVKIKAKIGPSNNKKKPAKIVVSAGNQVFNHETNTATAIDKNPTEEPRVAISGSALGSMYGDKVNFIVTDSAAGVDFGGLILGDDNIEITASGDIKVRDVVSKKDVRLASQDGRIHAKGLVTGTNTKISGKKVTIEATQGHLAATNQVTVTAQDTIAVNGKVTGNDVQLTAKEIIAGDDTAIKARYATLDITQDLDNINKFTQINKVFDKTTVVKDVTLKTTNLTVNLGEEVTLTAVNNFVVNGKVKNFGILNFASKEQNIQNSTLISAANGFYNYGLLLADNLGVKSLNEIDLSGATFIYSDALLLAQNIDVKGNLAVGNNVTVFTDNFNVTGNINGSTAITADQTIQANHYADWRLRRDAYNITLSFGNIDFSNINVVGGDLTVKGSLNLYGLSHQDEAAAQFTDSTKVTSKQNKLNFAIKNANANIYGDLNVDGNVYNTVDEIKVKVADLLKVSGKVSFSYQPRTWINTGLMRVKTQTFNSVYDMFQGLFGNTEFSWRNGAYQIRGDFFLDTLRDSIKDTYALQLLATIFGSDWKAADFNTLKTRWNNFVNNPEQFQINLAVSGGQVTIGGNYTQSNGNLFVGTNNRPLTVLDAVQGKHYFTSVNSGQLATKKITRSTAVINFDKENQQLLNKYKKVASQFHDLANIKSFATLAEPSKLAGDDVELALNIIQQVKEQTGNFLLKDKSASELVNDFINNTQKFTKHLADLNSWYQEKMDTNLPAKTKEFYTKQYNLKLERLNTRYDYLVFTQTTDGKYIPEIKLSPRTERLVSHYNDAAAIIEANENLAVVNAETVNTNNALIKGKNVTLDAQVVDLAAAQGSTALDVVEETVINAKDLTITGSANLGDAQISADSVVLKGQTTLDQQGNQKIVATATAQNLDIVAKEELELNAYKLQVAEEALISAGTVSLIAGQEVSSSYSKEDLKDVIGTTATKTLEVNAVGSEIHAKDLALSTDLLHLQSAKINGEDSAEIIVAGDLIINTVENYKEVTTHTEAIKLGADVSGNFGGYAGSVSIALADTSGNAKVEHSLTPKDANTANVKAGFGVTYTVTDSVTTAKTTENNEFNSQNLNLQVHGTAELGNTDINANADIVDPSQANAHIQAAQINSEQAKNEFTKELTETTVGFSVSSNVKSPNVDALSNAVANVAKVISNAKGGGLNASPVIGVVKGVIGLADNPSVTVGVNTKLEVKHEKHQEQIVSDNRNNYKGNLKLEAKDINLKAVDGKELSAVDIKAQTLNIEGGITETSSTTNKVDFNLGVNADIAADKTGANAKFTTQLGTEVTLNNKAENKHDQSELNANSVKIDTESTVLDSTTITANNIEVESSTLDIISRQDTINSHTTAISVGAKVGVQVNALGLVSPTGNVQAGVSHQVEQGTKVNQVSGITGKDNLQVAAQHITLEGAVIQADNKGIVRAESVAVSDLQNNHKVDGGQGSLYLDFDQDGVKNVKPSGGRLAHSNWEATTHSSIITNDFAADVIDGNLNTDSSKVTEVIKDEKKPARSFSFTYNKDVENKVQQQIQEIKDKFNSIREQWNPKPTTSKEVSSSTSSNPSGVSTNKPVNNQPSSEKPTTKPIVTPAVKPAVNSAAKPITSNTKPVVSTVNKPISKPADLTLAKPTPTPVVNTPANQPEPADVKDPTTEPLFDKNDPNNRPK